MKFLARLLCESKICVTLMRDGVKLFNFLLILQHRTYTHIFDQVKQDWFAVVSVLEHTLRTVMKQLPCITTAYLRSDNAGCYHCGNTLLSLDGISERTGMKCIYILLNDNIFLYFCRILRKCRSFFKLLFLLITYVVKYKFV